MVVANPEIAGTFRDCHADPVAFFARQHPDVDSAADLRPRLFVVDAAPHSKARPAAVNSAAEALPAWRNDRELLIQTRRPPGDGRDTWAIWQRGIPLRWLDETWTDTERETLPLVRE